MRFGRLSPIKVYTILTEMSIPARCAGGAPGLRIFIGFAKENYTGFLTAVIRSISSRLSSSFSLPSR